MANLSTIIDRVTDRLLRLLRVPMDPRLPWGDPAEAQIFRGGHSYWRLLRVKWALKQAGSLTALTLAWVFAYQIEWFVVYFVPFFYGPLRGQHELVLYWFRLIEQLAWVGFFAQLPFSYLGNHIAYRLRWYVITDRAARLRHGLLVVHEQTLTLANVQRVELHQGPLQRWLGLCDLHVHTAGGGGEAVGEDEKKKKQSLRIAQFEGIDLKDAAKVRARLEAQRAASLDSDANSLPEALRQLAQSSRRLREWSEAP